jgi:hypothetical protein
VLVCFFLLCAPQSRGDHREHRISVPCGAALLLLPALDICCHSRTCGCLACTLRGPDVCFAPRDVVSVDGSAQCAHILPLVAPHAQLQVTDGLVYIDELFIKRYFSSLFLSRRALCRGQRVVHQKLLNPPCPHRAASHAVTTVVGRLVNGGGGGSHGCVVGVASARSSVASLASTLLCFVHHTDLCSCSCES